MRVLLTGATGYIGLHILRELLDAGHDVTALVRSPEKLGIFSKLPCLKIIEADLEQDTALNGVLEGQDVCVHCALIWSDKSDSELSLQDTSIAAKLFHTAGRAAVKRCIYISSTAVHRPFSQNMSEEDRLSTADTYGATKAAAELFLRSACAEYGMTGIVVRLGPVVGLPAFKDAAFRSNNRLVEMVKAALAGRPIETNKGEGRQWTDVAVAAKTIGILVSAPNPFPTYLCVDREIIEWEKIAHLVVTFLRSKSEVHIVAQQSEAPCVFNTSRIASLLGKPADATAAISDHIRYLAARHQKKYPIKG